MSDDTAFGNWHDCGGTIIFTLGVQNAVPTPKRWLPRWDERLSQVKLGRERVSYGSGLSMFDSSPDEDNQSYGQGKEQSPDNDVRGEFNEQNDGRLRNAALAEACAGRIGGTEHEDHSGPVVMERSADLDDEGISEANDSADESGEANRMRTSP
jgi:hypothetical protein